MKNLNKRKGVVYCLIDPFDNQVRYVGFTVSKLRVRIAQHRYIAKKQLNRTAYSINWYRNCLDKGKEPLVKVLETDIPKDLWKEREDYWISNFDNLTNQREGGCGIVIDR